MASPQANTKIERAVDAIEGLTVAVVASHHGVVGPPGESRKRYDDVRDARQELREAFSDFLSPVLRVVAPEGQ